MNLLQVISDQTKSATELQPLKSPVKSPVTSTKRVTCSTTRQQTVSTLTDVQILDILNNQPVVKIKKLELPKPMVPKSEIKTEVRSKSKVGVFPTKATAAKFRISSHHLKRKPIRKYYFKCSVAGCTSSFNTVKDWNVHHLFKHQDVKYLCSQCNKTLRTRASMKDHECTHRDKPYTCGRCGTTFVNVNRLNLNRHVHCRQRLHSCFTSHCDRRYKCPQDLLGHIKKHLKVNHKCHACTYTTHERRLLRRHMVLHSDVLPYQCRKTKTRIQAWDAALLPREIVLNGVPKAFAIIAIYRHNNISTLVLLERISFF